MDTITYPITRADLVWNSATRSYFVGDFLLVSRDHAGSGGWVRFDVFQQIDGDEVLVAENMSKGEAVAFINAEQAS